MKKVWRIWLLSTILFSMVALVQAAGVIQEGDWGQDVSQIQEQLSAQGYQVGTADGEFGAMTTSAVKAFQQDRGLTADGVIGAATYKLLMGRDIAVSRGDGSVTIARRVIQTAMRFVGVPYSFGGTSPDGFDCSGFVRYVFARSGIDLPRMADQQYEIGHAVSLSQLQPGDTVYFTTYTSGISHVGIYLGDERFISATSSRGVRIDRLDSGYWAACYVGARRLF
ncbi:MAG: NlpC/P60 family protein [Negativicutes bacterium]|nr:NlpC/P60 family protein [Negativicutes bacterium]